MLHSQVSLPTLLSLLTSPCCPRKSPYPPCSPYSPHLLAVFTAVAVLFCTCCYTAILYLLRLLRAGADDLSGALEVLTSATALGIEPLTRLCEATAAEAVDETEIIEALILADSLGCSHLRAFCLHFLHQHFGAFRTATASLPPPPAIETLSGYDRLTPGLLEEVELAVAGDALAAGLASEGADGDGNGAGGAPG